MNTKRKKQLISYRQIPAKSKITDKWSLMALNNLLIYPPSEHLFAWSSAMKFGYLLKIVFVCNKTHGWITNKRQICCVKFSRLSFLIKGSLQTQKLLHIDESSRLTVLLMFLTIEKKCSCFLDNCCRNSELNESTKELFLTSNTCIFRSWIVI